MQQLERLDGERADPHDLADDPGAVAQHPVEHPAGHGIHLVRAVQALRRPGRGERPRWRSSPSRSPPQGDGRGRCYRHGGAGSGRHLVVAKAEVIPPVTPDGRYIVVRGRLWRRANPDLPDAGRQALVDRLMDARRAVGSALRAQDMVALATARAAVDAAKVALGERGPVWWRDGAPDLTRRMARNTPYADWFASLG